MAQFPFVVIVTAQAAANGRISLSYQVNSGRKFLLQSIQFASDGVFSIINITSSRGKDFSNASNANGIPSTMLPLTSNQNNTLKFPLQPIDLMGGDVFTIEFLDTSSSANDIWMTLNGIMDDG